MKSFRNAMILFSAGILLAFLCIACGHKPPENHDPSDNPDPPAASSDTAQEQQQEEEPGDPPPPPPSDDAFVLVTDYIPGIQVELKYATEDNFTHTVIYEFDEAYLRYGTVKKLAAAQEIVSADGYTLKIWDAFRPAAAQYKLWEICPDPVYVANPNKGFSSHSRGNTVDVTLVYADGSAAEMPTGFDDFSAKADRDYSDVDETAAGNAAYLENVMESCGFKPYSGEWWHFSDETAYDVAEDFDPSAL